MATKGKKLRRKDIYNGLEAYCVDVVVDPTVLYNGRPEVHAKPIAKVKFLGPVRPYRHGGGVDRILVLQEEPVSSTMARMSIISLIAAHYGLAEKKKVDRNHSAAPWLAVPSYSCFFKKLKDAEKYLSSIRDAIFFDSLSYSMSVVGIGNKLLWAH